MATHSSTLAWKIPWTGGAWWAAVNGAARSQTRLSTSLSLFTFLHWRRQWQPTPVFLPGESHGRGSLRAAVYGVAQSRTRLERLSSSSNSPYPWGFLQCHDFCSHMWDIIRGRKWEMKCVKESKMESSTAKWIKSCFSLYVNHWEGEKRVTI